MTGDIRVDSKYRDAKYRDAIMRQLEDELNLSYIQKVKILRRLNEASSDEIERLYEAFDRFGVQNIINCIV